MAKEAVVVGLDRIVWTDNLLYQTTRVLRVSDRIPREVPTKTKQERLAAIAEYGVRDQRHRTVMTVARQAAYCCIGRLNPQMVDQLEGLSRRRYRFVGMSSAPDFAVRAALEMLQAETGIGFSDHLSSHFNCHEDVYTGKYAELHKRGQVQDFLARNGLPEVAIGFINGISDLRWTEGLCAQTVVVNPGHELSKQHLPGTVPAVS